MGTLTVARFLDILAPDYSFMGGLEVGASEPLARELPDLISWPGNCDRSGQACLTLVTRRGLPMDQRPDFVVIDLSAVSSREDLHTALAQALDFPDFYGRNWSAFWDSITGFVEMPHRLVLKGWPRFAAYLPGEARHLQSCLEEMSQQYPELAAEVEYA